MDGIITSNDTILNKWEFPIEMIDLEAIKQPAQCPDGKFHRYEVPPSIARALVRTDTGDIMGVHGNKYKPITHDNVVNSITDAVKRADVSKDYTTTVEVYEDGRKLKGCITFPDLTVEPTVGDITCLRIPFYNSYDASWSFSQSVEGMRLTCLNGQTIADMIAKTTFKHTLNVDVEGSARKIEQGTKVFLEHKDIWQSWMDIKVDDFMAEDFFKATIGKVFTHQTAPKFNNTTMESIMRIWHTNASQLGSNKWALYNAMTYWSTHTDQSRVPHNATKRRQVDVQKAMTHKRFEFA